MSCGKSVAVVAAASEPKEAPEQQRRAVGTTRHEPTNRMDAFPWMTEFRAMSRLPTQPGSLVKLIKFFNKHVSANVGDCYKKSSRAARLKDHVREALLLFMYLYRFEQPQDQNRAVYLEQMSDLLAVYVDLELIASKRETEPQPSRIAARLVSSLCLCLENSTEHLLDTLIKVQLVNETFSDILDPVISKVIKLSSPPPPSKLDGLAYARYLLVYRLWKRLHINLAARKNIVAAALEALQSEPPSDLPTEILVECGVLPSSQNTQSDRPTTKHYLCQSYDLRNACVEFIKYLRSQNVADEVVQPNVVVASTSSSSSSSECSERDPRLKKSTLTSATSDHPARLNNINNNNSVNKLPTEPSKLNPVKPISKPQTKSKIDDIVLIDLTDEEVTKIVKRKRRTKIHWLEAAKRNFHAKIVSLKVIEKPAPIAEDTKQCQPVKVQEKEVSSMEKKIDETSALSNGQCSVIRETGRPAAVVTPKTDIQPKVQAEEAVESVVEQLPSEPEVASFYDGIDGLALLASVSAQQQVSTAATTTTTTTTKKPELKVKPYTTLQQPVESLVEDTMDKVALQVEVCSSEQLPTKQEYSYILEEQAVEGANDNANVILNGETVMLLQKSPNSNLYIINKAAVDSSKLNYNSDDEVSDLMQPEDVKPTLKMEPEYTNYPPHCMHQVSVDCTCVSCAYCRPYFLPQVSNDKEKSFARFKEVDCKLPLKKRLKAQRMMDFHQTENYTPPPQLELGAVVEVTTANKSRGRAKKDKSVNQNVPNCFPRKPGSKKKRVTSADDEVENNMLAPAKKARRSSRRGLAAVSYVYEPEANPSGGRRKKKRSTR